MAKLTKNVAVDGVWYGPDWGDQDVPEEIAAKIEREDVWAGYEAPEPEPVVKRPQEPLRKVTVTGSMKTPEDPERDTTALEQLAEPNSKRGRRTKPAETPDAVD